MALFIYIFKKIHQKMKSLQILKGSLSVNSTSKFGAYGIYKIAISTKTMPFGAFCIFFLESMIVWYYLSKLKNDFSEHEVSKHFKQ